MPAPLAHALKLVLPSWNFFDDFSATPRLEFRVRANDNSAAGDWQLLYAAHSTQSVARTFYDPHGNAELFELALVETAADELKLLKRDRRDSFLDSEIWSRLGPLLMHRTRDALQSRAGVPPAPVREVKLRLRLTTRQGDPEEWFETPWLPLAQPAP